ncbi:MAG TPA: hypothetical protein VFH78_05065 [Candidatus Thermoplasmatota archaeon]|nr:hypothetical protein [Candidatus Thermoplasmatota archaeon]
MALVATLVGSVGLSALAAVAAAALLVLFARPDRTQNRLLALVLLLEAFASGAGAGLMWLTDDPRSSYAWQAVTIVAAMSIPFAYLAFLGTLPGPYARPFRGRGRHVALALALVAPLPWFLWPRAFAGHVEPWTLAPWIVELRPAFTLVLLLTVAAALYGLLVAFGAWRVASSPSEKAQAKAFLLAFGVRDVGFCLALGAVGVGLVTTDSTLFAVGPSIVQLLYAPLLVYGILRTQLFDIDLRLKWTIRRATLLGAFAVVFVGVAEVAQNVASDAYGYLAGGVATALMLLALRPIERMSARIADSAMPHVQETPTYVAYRKMEVYRAALEGAMQDGAVTEREREVLRRLRASLGLSDADVAALERDVAAAPR